MPFPGRGGWPASKGSRGCSRALPLHEPRLCRGAAIAYGLDEPPGREWLEERAQAWRPYRTWVVLLLRVLLEAETGETGGTRDVGGRR
jgi:3-methyladenine DNA glycosylase/8-oxoguanine DNA glycosylase